MKEIRKHKGERWSIDLTDESEVSKSFKCFEINFSRVIVTKRGVAS